MDRDKRFHPLLWSILLSAPFVLWAKLQIQPTFDDWTTLSSPNFDPEFVQYFLPYGPTWRPFDSAIGYVYYWIGPQYFPALSHLLIFLAHLCSTFMVYRLAQVFRFSTLAQAMAAVFFWTSPCMLATVFACDSLNQSFSQLWGLVAIYVYLICNGKWRHPLWLFCVLLATFSKENGLAWAVLPPLLAFGFQRIDRRTLLRHLSYGIALSITYAVVRLSVPSTEVYYEEYHSFFDLGKKVKSVAILLCYTFLPGDYIYVVHSQSRNIPLFLLTLLPTLPFLSMLVFCKKESSFICHFATFALCAIITVSPNLLITMSMMNAYAWLAIISMAIGVCVHHIQCQRGLLVAFTFYLIAVSYTNMHHWYCTWQTSMPARYMALEAIKQTGHPVERVYVITVESQERKFSSFITLPTEAFAWGRAVWGQTRYEWPREIADTLVSHGTATTTIDSLAHQALQKGYECVWVIENDRVMTISPNSDP